MFFSLRGKDNSLFTNPGLHFLKKQYIRADVVGNGHQTLTLRRRIRPALREYWHRLTKFFYPESGGLAIFVTITNCSS